MPKRFIFRSCYWENLATYMTDGEIRAKYHESPQIGNRISYEAINNRRGVEYLAPNQESINRFVPFYFSPIQGMSLAIANGSVDLTLPDGSQPRKAEFFDLAFVVARLRTVVESVPFFYFTDRGVNSGIPATFSSDARDITTLVDWTLFDEHPICDASRIDTIGYSGVCKWAGNSSLQERWHDRRSLRMAEFLVHNSFDFNLIECIVVFNSDVKSAIESWEIFGEYNIPVLLKPKYF